MVELVLPVAWLAGARSGAGWWRRVRGPHAALHHARGAGLPLRHGMHTCVCVSDKQ